MDSRNLGVGMRACVVDLAVGFARQIDSKGMKVVAGGAALALILGLGAGALGRAPIDRALHPHPMNPVPGTSQVATATPPLMEAPSQPPVAPIRVAERDDTPAIATGDDPSGDSQVASTDETQVDTPVAGPAPDNAQPPATLPPRPRYSRRDVYRYREGPPDYPPTPWAYRGPPQWAPPPPPPDYDPD
ncbi:MAG TPA: hypothetical protein VGF71_15775 [Caulobacteraceae bacterium]|jgi:hypothetical protein